MRIFSALLTHLCDSISIDGTIQQLHVLQTLGAIFEGLFNRHYESFCSGLLNVVCGLDHTIEFMNVRNNTVNKDKK